ncbi:MAG: hypothetical protein KJO55_02175, partial [Gammaproteobacteria bacterium]|nr:hypothetical protein [Gammaproteobacteria bacterium]
MWSMSRRDTALFALFALFAGALVYLGARPDSAYAMGGSAAAFANLPSFLHTVAFAIAIALCFEMRTARWLAALAWGS